VRRRTGDSTADLSDATGPGDGGGDAEDLRRTVHELEMQLEQMSGRLRHAYAQAEAAQALVSDARQRGDIPPESTEMTHLRTELDQLRTQLTTSMAKAQEAEERASRAEADLQALGSGVGVDVARPAPEDTPVEEPTLVEDDKPEGSLRSRLARTATRKKHRDDAADYG
jgi:hypothetical protein